MFNVIYQSFQHMACNEPNCDQCQAVYFRHKLGPKDAMQYAKGKAWTQEK